MENRICFCAEENEAVRNIHLVSLEFYIQNYSASIQNIRNAFQLEHVNRELPPGSTYNFTFRNICLEIPRKSLVCKENYKKTTERFNIKCIEKNIDS